MLKWNYSQLSTMVVQNFNRSNKRLQFKTSLRENVLFMFQVNSLKIEAARAGILPTSKAPRGRGKIARGRGRGGVTSVRGRGRGGARGGRGGGVTEVGGASRLDRRPGAVVVTGFAEDTDREELVGHFRKFGEIVEVIHQVEISMMSTSDTDRVH